MALTDFSKILKGTTYQLNTLAEKSKSWFLGEVNKFKRLPINQRSFIAGDPKRNTSRIEIGKMYMFQYSPKGIDKLEVWDEFPLALPFSPTEDGFIAINFHYLPYNARAWILNQLTKRASTKNNRLRVSWEILNAVSRVDIGKMATHRYIANNIISQIRMIEIDNYAKAIMLPIHKFHGNRAEELKKMF